VPHPTDLDLTESEVAELASPDAITAFFSKLGYDTADRAVLSPEAVGLAGESAHAIKRIELLSEDPEQFLRVVCRASTKLMLIAGDGWLYINAHRILGKSLGATSGRSCLTQATKT
jgi:hypothetical protein